MENQLRADKARRELQWAYEGDMAIDSAYKHAVLAIALMMPSVLTKLEEVKRLLEEDR